MTLQEIYKKIASCKIVDIEGCTGWLINIKDFYEYSNEIKKSLSSEEVEKSNKIRIEKKKLTFFLRKGITRIILSHYFNINLDEVRYDYNEYGKPFISHRDYKNYGFNISHSKEYLFVGIVKDKEIGVDIEKINLGLNHHLLAESVFSTEEMALYNNYDDFNKLCSFYKAWVQKEAISKAIGRGIAIGFNEFSVNINPNNNEEEYITNVKSVQHPIIVRVKCEDNYYKATALI